MQDPSENAGVERIPPRFWWLKRLSILSAVLIIALVALRLSWGWEAQRRLDVLIAEWRAAGQPVYAREFDEAMDAVADEDNAAILYEQAMNAMVATTTSGVAIEDFLYERNAFDANMPGAVELMQANAGVFDLVRQARGKPDVAWSERLSGVPTPPQTLGSPQRTLSKLLWFSGMYRFSAGNHAATVAILHDYMLFSAAIEAHPSQLSTMFGRASHGLCFSAVEEVASKLRIDDESAGVGEDIRSSSRESVARLVHELANEEACRRSAVQAYYGSRAMTVENIDASPYLYYFRVGRRGPMGYSPWDSALDPFVKPVVVLDVVRYLRWMMFEVEAIQEESYPAEARHLHAQAAPDSLVLELARPTTGRGMFGNSADRQRRAAAVFYHSLAIRRMAATALAIRLYVVDHGRRPEILAELAPTYLSEIPLDPFSPNGSPIGYRPLADPPVLYSVWENGVDGGGSVVKRSRGGADRERSDLLFYLDGKPIEEDAIAASPSTQTGEDEQNAEESHRQRDQGKPSK